MRRKKGSAAIALAVLLAAVLLGGTYYAATVLVPEQRDPAQAGWTTLEPGGTGGTAASGGPAGTSPQRTDGIITCRHPDIGEFYTNAPSCEEADPHNRISIAGPPESTPAESRYSGQGYRPPEEQAGNSRSDR